MKTYVSDMRGKRGGVTKPAQDGGPKVEVVPVNKLPGHDPNLEARTNTVNALREAVDELHNLASGKLGEDAIYARIEAHIDDIAKWRV
jgi:hypothetical protein